MAIGKPTHRTTSSLNITIIRTSFNDVTNLYPAMMKLCFSFVGPAGVSFLPGEERLASARPAFD
jgi:hypothetical protein